MSSDEERYYAPPASKSTHRKKAKKRTVGSDEEEDVESEMPQSTVNGGTEFADDFSTNNLNNVSENQLHAQIAAVERELNQGKKREDKRKQKEEAARVKREAKIAAQEEQFNKIPALKALTAGKKKQNLESDEEMRNNALLLIARMNKAFEQDQENNLAKRPAIQKMLLLEEITKELRKKSLQDHFLDNGGCKSLGNWLSPLPDETTPNQRIVQEVLECIESLEIDQKELDNTHLLKRVVKFYASGEAKVPQAQQTLAKKIVDKWQRQEKGISTSYRQLAKEDMDTDAVGMTNADESYRVLREGIEAMRDQVAVVHSDADGSEDEPADGAATSAAPGQTAPGQKRPRKNVQDQSEQEVLRTRAGIILPVKNGFDFLEKPKSRVDMGMISQRNTNKNSSMENLKKAMMNMKKKNQGFQGNSKMQIVKNDVC